MTTEFARSKYRVTGHNEPGLAGKVTHILEPFDRNGPGPGIGGVPNIETTAAAALPKGTIIETVSTWAVVE